MQGAANQPRSFTFTLDLPLKTKGKNIPLQDKYIKSNSFSEMHIYNTQITKTFMISKF